MSELAMRSVFGFLIVLTCLSGAFGQGDPPTMSVKYQLHQNPVDPNSPVTFIFVLSLKQEQVNQLSAGWRVTSMEFRERDLDGGADVVWIDSDPNVATPDGLWWVEHKDPQSPQNGEFIVPPALSGTAIQQGAGVGDAQYQIQGVISGGPTPYATTAVLDYVVGLVAQPWPPIITGNDEPVEIPPNQPPPGSV